MADPDTFSWTNQLYYIVTDDSDQERFVRATTAQEAAFLYVKHRMNRYDDSQQDAWDLIEGIYKIPVEPGLTQVLGWREEIEEVVFVRPAFSPDTSGETHP